MFYIGVFLTDIFKKTKQVFIEASWIANFSTILLFVIFVIGKIWILWRNRALYDDNIEYISVQNAEDEYNHQYILDEGECDVIKISSVDGIYDLNVYEVKLTPKGKYKKGKKVDSRYEDNICHPLKLNKNEAVYIRTKFGGIVPRYMIEIKKYDYTVITAILCMNGKVGGISLLNQKVKRNPLSWLYYLCK